MHSSRDLDGDYVKSYYNSFLSKYDKEYAYYRWQAGPVERLHFFQTRAAIFPYVKRISGAVLEIGGGDGIWTREYITHIDHLTFLDISSEMVTRAQKRLADFSERITYINKDFLQNDFLPNTFDTIVSIRNLEYFADKERFMAEVARLLKTGGSFLLVTKSPKYDLKDDAKEKTLHRGQIEIKRLLQILQHQGLKIGAVYPAIFGKLFRYSLFRLISRVAHRLLLILPWKVLPLRPLSYVSESFVVYAKK